MGPHLKRILAGWAALAAAAAVWVPSVHLVFRRDPAALRCADSVSPDAERLAARFLRLWTDPALRAAEIGRMRATNAEWDFMGRSFLVWSFAEIALRDPGRKPVCLEAADRIIEETLRLESEKGSLYFLMDYARARPFVDRPARSQFVDGEIALMLASRRAVEEKAEYQEPLRERVRLMTERMSRSPVLSAESYPDECWTFCNTVALAAIRASDVLDGTDHSDLARVWVRTAREQLVHRETGLLVSSYALDGTPMDGPEGSSIWMAVHCLRLVDPEFAADQYARARRELGRDAFGFGWAREWPPSWRGPMDVDSGPVIPVLEVSAGSSGLAFLGASAFGDREYFASLRTSLDFAAFPVATDGGLRYAAGNAVGDAVLLYAAVQGPLWKRFGEGLQQ